MLTGLFNNYMFIHILYNVFSRNSVDIFSKTKLGAVISIGYYTARGVGCLAWDVWVVIVQYYCLNHTDDSDVICESNIPTLLCLLMAIAIVYTTVEAIPSSIVTTPFF